MTFGQHGKLETSSKGPKTKTTGPVNVEQGTVRGRKLGKSQEVGLGSGAKRANFNCTSGFKNYLQMGVPFFRGALSIGDGHFGGPFPCFETSPKRASNPQSPQNPLDPHRLQLSHNQNPGR